MKKKMFKCLPVILASLLLAGCGATTLPDDVPVASYEETIEETTEKETETYSGVPEALNMHEILSSNKTEVIPVYSGEQMIELNNGIPYFKETDKTTQMFEIYSSLDNLGRCGRAFANICWEVLPTEKRGEIGSVKPSGWILDGKSNNHKYEWVDGSYVINRCHLIAYELSGENANEENLITGTRSMNLTMLPYENKVAQYVKETDNHVLYRVTPIFYEDDLVAQGVEMEGYSVEDNGEGINFHIFVYNVEPGVVFDYATGNNWAADGSVDLDREKYQSALGTYREADGSEVSASELPAEVREYVLNTNSKKIHLPECENAEKIAEKNREETKADIRDLLDDGYTKCGTCLKTD